MATESEEKLERMLLAFERTQPLAGGNFRTLLGNTPELKAGMLEAIESGNLEKFTELDPLKLAAGKLGEYTSREKAIALPVSYLEVADRRVDIANTMRMVLTHESEHAVNRDAITRTNEGFYDKVGAIANGPSPHDYTEVIKDLIQNKRVTESNDQIAGFNAVAGYVRRQNPDATQQQLYGKMYDATPEMQPYFDKTGSGPSATYTLKSGFTLGADGKLAPTPENIDAMKTHFFDAPARDYPGNYRHQALNYIYGVERRTQVEHPDRPTPEIRVDMRALDALGKPLPPGFIDSSPSRVPSPITPTEVPHDSSRAAQRDSRTAEAVPALYLQSVNALEKLGPGAGIHGRDQLGAVAAAMASKAQTDGLRQIDAVVASTDGKGLIAIQGDPGSAQAKNSYVDRAEAAQQPMAHSLSQLEKNPPPPEVAQQQAQAGPSR